MLAVVLRWLLVRAVNRMVRRTVATNVSDRIVENRATRVLASATGALTASGGASAPRRSASVLRSIVDRRGVRRRAADDPGRVRGRSRRCSRPPGVVGVALGFGAQSLVKDFLSGIFMLVEDQYGVGDVVDTGEAVGTVEEVTLRVTRLRDGSGVVWYVRNGEIIRIGNKSQGWSTAIVDLPVAYTENIERVTDIIRAAVRRDGQRAELVEACSSTPTVAGVEQITGTTVTIRVIAKCAPNEQCGAAARDPRAGQGSVRRGRGRAPVTFPPVAGAAVVRRHHARRHLSGTLGTNRRAWLEPVRRHPGARGNLSAGSGCHTGRVTRSGSEAHRGRRGRRVRGLRLSRAVTRCTARRSC